MKLRMLSAIFIASQLLGQTLQKGDSYHYNVYFEDLIKLGESNLSVIGEERMGGFETFHLKFSIRTSSLGDKIYKIRNSVESWIKKEDYTVLKQIKKSREKNFKRDFTTEVLENKAISNSKEFLVPDKIFDPYSLILTLQNLYDISIPDPDKGLVNQEKKNEIHFDILDGSKIRKLSLINEGVDIIRTPLGKFNAVTFKPKNPLKNGDMEISYGYYENRLVPIKISLALNSGVVVMKIKRVER